MICKRSRHLLAGLLAFAMLLQLLPITAMASDANVAKGKRAFACHSESASLTPDKALDGDSKTRFAAGASCQHDAYYVVDLEDNYDVSGVKITWDAAHPSSYAIEISDDGQNFTTVASEDSVEAGEHSTALNASGRFIRIREIKRALAAYGFSIYELEVYGSVSAQSNTSDYVIITAAESSQGSLALSHSGFVKVGTPLTVTSSNPDVSLETLLCNGVDMTKEIKDNTYTFTVSSDAHFSETYSSRLSEFECEDAPVYTTLDMNKTASPNVQPDAAASGGKIAGGTGGKYYLFEGVTEANGIKLAYASTNTNTISVWVRYPGETELRAMPSIAFSTTNSWSMGSSASYTATSPIFYIPEGSDVILRPNSDCNLDRMWLVYENNVTSASAPANTLAADKISASTADDIMAPYAKAINLTAGESVTFTAPDARSLYSVLSLSYCSTGAKVEYLAGGNRIAADTLDATARRTYEVRGTSSVTFCAGDKITLTCTEGSLSIGYVSFSFVPYPDTVRVPSLPAAGDRLAVDLDGTWAFDSESFDVWSVDQNVPSLDFVNSIPVPGLWSSAALELGNNIGHKAWYKKTVVLDSEPIGNVTLYIEQAQYGRYVYVNGTLVDTYGFNYSASYTDLTGLLHKGENEIVIMLGDFNQQLSSKDPNTHVLQDGESRYDMPGITGSVELIFNADPTVSKVQTNPDIDNGTLDVQITLDNKKKTNVITDVTVTVYELGVFKDGNPTMSEVKVAEYVKNNVTVTPGENKAFLIEDIALDGWSRAKCWTTDSPYLYRVEVRTSGDTYTTRIGMRTFGFDPQTKYYTLNGELIYLRGTNVAIERYYDDPLCGTTPWEEDWVRKLYSEYKATNWFSFRVHLGNANELWFDLADEMGFLIIDEYPQWGDTDGCTAKSIMPEIYRWMDLRANHASLFMFDAQNEATGTTFTNEICRLGRAYDLQNRTWDNGWRPPVFEDSPIECHPYFLDGKGVSGMGGDKYSKAVLSMANIGWDCQTYPTHPFILNEHGEIWVSRDGIPMSGTQGNWDIHLPDATPEERLTYYADVMAAQMEAFRAQRAYSGLLFFCGLGVDYPDHVGITCDILSPDVSTAESLQIRPYIQEQLKNAFADLGIVNEYYQQICLRGRKIQVPVKLVNDTGADVNDLTVVLTVQNGDTVLYADRATMSVGAFSADDNGLATHTFEVEVPAFKDYCKNGEELQIVASYTLDGETYCSRRKLTVKGGRGLSSDPLPEYDWLKTEEETTTPSTETEPIVTNPIETDPIETEPIASGTAPQPENPKKGCGSAVIPSAAVVALTVGAVACAKKKKKDD